MPLTPFFLPFLCPLAPPVCLCPHLPNVASLLLLLLFILLRLLQTDVLSHHLQRNLIYLDSQVRVYSCLSPSQAATVRNFKIQQNILLGTGTYWKLTYTAFVVSYISRQNIWMYIYDNLCPGFYFCLFLFSTSLHVYSEYFKLNKLSTDLQT